MKGTRKHSLLVVWCVLAALGVCIAAQAEIVDRILATVDTEVILESEIMQTIQSELAAVQATPENQERLDALKKEALQEAIDARILLREGMLASVEVTDEQVEEQIEKVRKTYPSSEEFQKELERAGESLSDLRNRLKKQGIAQKYAAAKFKDFEKDAKVDESEVNQYYQEHLSEFVLPDRVRVWQIFLSCGSDRADRQAARARLAELKEQLAGGADFSELAKAHSEAPGAEQGGILGWVQKGDLVPELEKAVFSLSEGEISDVLDLPSGVTLMKVEKKATAGQASMEEVRTRIEPLLRTKAAQVRYDAWLGELRKRSRIEIFM